ncbi:UV-damaged DNA-binding protein rad7 [Purpureocillium takamizusanense]|uniref:UV-damaged DNA-binding protein rad7 n=1 Tax=Purpureocillium takamizusanense TaxID=2060973 RepID=A0A9Q8QF28_9HYPO|nr:UV-damaged DNA-binding protein rad7 [Purpureocillium takamizusanense]UNI19644.1 UV-damaged DNA-binding protein rad7 [Purpureocillium takamizusanense]
MARQNQDQNQRQGQNTRPTRNITGPQSALTDFLASHNISARQIRDEAEHRRQQALSQAEQNGEQLTVTVAESSSSGRRRASRVENDEQKSKKKAEEAKAIEKIKASKAFKKRKKNAYDSDDDDEIARAIFEAHHAPLPGQIENCAICSKRFTVTPYSLAGPDGGLLCAPCGKELAKEKQGQPKKKPRKQAGGVGSRRAMASRILDGDVGTKSLATLCVQTLAKNVDLADSLGDLPEHLVDKIARIFSKRRLLKSETLPLFAQPLTETVHIYDGARLGEQDFISIFQVAPNLKRFKARAAIQFKDEVMDYVLSRNTSLESFYLHGANLLSEEKWHEFLAAKGQNLRGLQVYYTDKHFGDDSIVTIAKYCPNLQRLKVENNQKMTDKGVEAIGELSSLQHLGLQLQNRTAPESITRALSKVGGTLRTLSLKIVPDADDRVLEAIHEHCHSLAKLRITESEHMTDKGFADLFTNWANPPLQFLDLQKCRHVDSTRPRHNDDGIGLCSDGFKALMAHSGSRLEHLNVHACRHISREAFEEAFDEKAHYPELKKLEISFCEEVTDFILGCVFRACPKIKEINVFGCMKVRDVRVPRGVIMVGVPNAQGMITEGTE